MKHGCGAAVAAGFSVCVWLAAVAWPAWAAVGQAHGDHVPSSFNGLRVAGTTLAWALGIAVLAGVPAWVAGRAMRDSSVGTFVLGASILAAVLPPYAVYWTWWQAAGPGSALGDWLSRTGHVDSARAVLLGVGLVSWSWPLTAWCIASQGDDSEAEIRDLQRIDRAGWRHAVQRAWRSDWPALAAGVALTAFVVAGSTIAFDLAQVATWGFELRTLDVQGTPVGGVLRAAWPALAVAAVGAVLLAAWPVRPRVAAAVAPRRQRGEWALVVVVLSVALPIAVLIWVIAGQGVLWSFGTVALRGALGTLATAAVAGALGGGVALGHLALAARGAMHDRRSGWVRGVERVMLAGWLLAALAPGTVYALAVTVAYNRTGWFAALYDSPGIVALAEIGRYGAAAAWLGRLAAWHEPVERRQLRALDAGPWNGAMTAMAPQAWAAALGGALVVAALGAGDVVVASRVEPPGWAWAATSLLNAIHYQQPDAVLGTLLALVCLAGIAGVAAAIGLARLAALARAGAPLFGLACIPAWMAGSLAATLLGTSLVLGGCREAASAAGTMNATRWFGAPGRGPGRFEYPRAIDIDPRDGSVVVIDRQARIHRFDRNGTFLGGWQMPEFALGKPTGFCIGLDGILWVADTHYHRVIVFGPDGTELRRWGTYGKEPGQFIFPCDVALGPDGLVYVAEFGGNDRVQVFAQDGSFVRQFGRHGHAPGEFDRPQALAFGPNGVLYVADACNHRIQVLDWVGAPQRVIGGLGREAGQFVYPYGLRMLPDGTMLVAEFGGNRVQRLDAVSGAPLEVWSTVEGVPPPAAAFVTNGDGVLPIPVSGNTLRIPWATAWSDGEMYVLDSGHARVLVTPVPLRTSR